MADSNDDKVRSIVTVWYNQPSTLPIPERLQEIARNLYWYRNPPKKEDKADMEKWTAFVDSLPRGSTDANPEVMAAVEHYFYARSKVATGYYSSKNMKAMIFGYQLLKKFGADLRHNEENPTTPPSKLQQHWALTGATLGTMDLDQANATRKKNKQPTVEPPTFRMHENFTGSLGGKRLDTIKYSIKKYW